MLKKIVKPLSQVPFFEKVKIALLTASFFCIIACYTVLRELRDVIFIDTVGCSHLQHVQIASLFALVPALFLYALCVDRLKKHQLLYVYTLLYGIGGLFIAFYLGRPAGFVEWGTRSYVFGWLQYIFIEGYVPFVISPFLAFVSSVITPTRAAQSYAVIIGGSKLGGMLTAALAWWFLRFLSWPGDTTLRFLLILASLFIFLVPVLIFWLNKSVPESFMRGYEAHSVLDKKNKRDGAPWYQDLFSGLRHMAKYPYILGIFGLVFSWEIISVVLSYHRLGMCVMVHKTVAGLSSELFLQIFWTHVLSFFITCIGATSLCAGAGQRLTMMAVPILTGFLAVGFFTSKVSTVIIGCYILMRALNYSLALSVREVLYIPTTTEMRFKSKSWIDVFGAKFARGSGSLYGIFAQSSGACTGSSYLCFCLTIIGCWMMTAHFLGKRFEAAIKHQEVIG